MDKFCTKCGGKLDETGRCPNCEPTKKELRIRKREQKKAAKKAAKKEKWRKLSFKQKIKKICLRLLIIVLVLALITGGATGALVYFDIVDIPIVTEIFELFGIKKAEPEDETTFEADKDIVREDEDISNSQYTVEHPDADEYYQNNSDILSEEKASQSDTVLTESEAYRYLVERGFSDSPITTSYSVTGEYMKPMGISENSSAKHPIYETIYTSENGEIWSITIVNNTITAFPINYNYQQNKVVQVMLSEHEYMTSYDSEKDKFYKTIPYDNALDLRKIERIDADTLEKLTYGDIDKL